MPDRLSLSLWLRGGVTSQNQYRAFEKILRAFPFSKLASVASTLSVLAVDTTEPAVAEYPLEGNPDVDEIIRLAREFKAPDTAFQLDTYWDLWGLRDDGEWNLTPAAISILSFGPAFEHEEDENIRIEFGTETRFLPTEGPTALKMIRANIQSLLRLVHDLGEALPIEKRLLATESSVNFAARLQDLLAQI